VIVKTASPVLLRATLRGGQAFRWREHGDAFVGVLGDRPVLLREHPKGVEMEGAAPEATVREYLRLGDPYERDLEALAADPFLAQAITAYRGLRVLRQDPWECLVAFITSANNNVVRIEGLLDRLSLRAGDRVPSPWGTLRAFPGPEAVARLRETTLRSMGYGYRAPYLRETARRIAGGDLDLAALRTAPYPEAHAALLALPGVGPKVADCVCLFSLDKGEAFPVDVWIDRVVSEVYFGGAPLKPREVQAFARERWGARAGLAQQFLFHAARLQGIGAREGRRAPGSGEHREP